MHPESIPRVGPPARSFVFSSEVGKEQRREISRRRAETEAKIEDVVSSVETNGGMNFIFPMLRMFTDAEDVRKISEALEQLVPLLKDLDQLKRWDNAFALAETEPNFYHWAFGDLSGAVSTVVSEEDGVEPQLEAETPSQAPPAVTAVDDKKSHLREL